MEETFDIQPTFEHARNVVPADRLCRKRSGLLADFTSDVRTLSSALASASLDLYNRVSLELLPTPSKIHYIFTLRDIIKLVQVGDPIPSLPFPRPSFSL